MNFATWSIRNPIPVILLFALLALAGLWGFRALPIQAFPDLDVPTINVTLVQPGAAPPQLETEVARKVEDSLSTLTGLRHLRTSIATKAGQAPGRAYSFTGVAARWAHSQFRWRSTAGPMSPARAVYLLPRV